MHYITNALPPTLQIEQVILELVSCGQTLSAQALIDLQSISTCVERVWPRKTILGYVTGFVKRVFHAQL